MINYITNYQITSCSKNWWGSKGALPLLPLLLSSIIGLARTVINRTFGDFPAKITVPYMELANPTH
jgi:hypothetical protein